MEGKPFGRKFIKKWLSSVKRGAISLMVTLFTSNERQVGVSGHVLLKKGVGNLPKTSVAVVTQMATVDKGRLLQKIGTLIPPKKLGIKVLNGMES
jgi:mRNA-degrading endonuclease toxin of MazEF toxin-antitoxin module